MVDLVDRTTALERDWMGRAGDMVQVIYMVGNGDYCRETCTTLDAATASHEMCAAWARQWFERRADANAVRHVTGFRVERW